MLHQSGIAVGPFQRGNNVHGERRTRLACDLRTPALDRTDAAWRSSVQNPNYRVER